MERRTVAVIVPCFNGARFLAEALRSALDQSLPPDEVLVIDDGSMDESACIAESFEGVRCIRQANRGASAARNRGLEETRSEYVIFLDADDRLLPGALETGVRVLEAHPGHAFVYGHSRTIDAQGEVIEERDQQVSEAGYALLLSGCGLAPPAVAIFRRAPLESVGGFNPHLRLAEDHDLYLRLACRYPIYCHNRRIADYRQHDRNASLLSPAATLRAVLHTIRLQQEQTGGRADLEAAARRGRRHWRRVFGPHIPHEMLAGFRRRRFRQAGRAVATLARHYPVGFLATPAIVLQSALQWFDYGAGWESLGSLG